MKSKNPRFEVWQRHVTVSRTLGEDQVISYDWRWCLYARNGESIASGEGYTSRKDALRAVAAVKRAVLRIIPPDELAREGARRP